MKSKVFRVDISELPLKERGSIQEQLEGMAFMVLDRRDAQGNPVALDVIGDGGSGFASLDAFKAAAKLPHECIITDITGWDLLQWP